MEMPKKAGNQSRRHRSGLGFALGNAAQNIGHVIGQMFEPFRFVLYLLFVSPIKFVGQLFGIGNRGARVEGQSDRYFAEAEKVRRQMYLEGEISQFTKTLFGIITLPFWLPWRMIKALGRPRDGRHNF